jgi:polyisoprenoid-binding protein YceI
MLRILTVKAKGLGITIQVFRSFTTVSLLVVALGIPFCQSQSVHGTIEPAHSHVEFTIRHLSVASVHGNFRKLQGDISVDELDISKSHVDVTIFVDSINTDESSRDTVLKSADFFDTDAYPTAVFKSTLVARVGDQLKVAGNLTMHGITKPVELDVRPIAPSAGKPQFTSYEGSATLSRAAFQIGTAFPTALVGDDVKLSVSLDVVRK